MRGSGEKIGRLTDMIRENIETLMLAVCFSVMSLKGLRHELNPIETILLVASALGLCVALI